MIPWFGSWFNMFKAPNVMNCNRRYLGHGCLVPNSHDLPWTLLLFLELSLWFPKRTNFSWAVQTRKSHLLKTWEKNHALKSSENECSHSSSTAATLFVVAPSHLGTWTPRNHGPARCRGKRHWCLIMSLIIMINYIDFLWLYGTWSPKVHITRNRMDSTSLTHQVTPNHLGELWDPHGV